MNKSNSEEYKKWQENAYPLFDRAVTTEQGQINLALTLDSGDNFTDRLRSILDWLDQKTQNNTIKKEIFASVLKYFLDNRNLDFWRTENFKYAALNSLIFSDGYK